MSDNQALLSPHRKAQTINLDGNHYGTIAEIGAGQEVARVFFQAGGASGSIAKTMSAYDMTFSDSIYGKAPRYVSRERLQTMLTHEYSLLEERLADKRGDRSRFFVFADTVATSSKRTADGHGWLGIRFQVNPLDEPSDIIIHVRMWDKTAVQQQEALGIVGVNLIYGAFHYLENLERFIQSLVDQVGADRIEVDMLKLSGPAFAAVDNRLLALFLVRFGLTNAVLFAPNGEVLQPSEILYHRPVLVERGRFRPVTRAHVDMLDCATAQFLQEPTVKGKEVIVLTELSMNRLPDEGTPDIGDLLTRVDILGDIGHAVLVSNYPEFYRLVSYLRRYTKEMIGLALGIGTLHEVFTEKHYDRLEGGILESMGRMFRHAVRLYVYPMPSDTYERLLLKDTPAAGRTPEPAGRAADVLITARNFRVPEHLRHLYAHLLENRAIDCLAGYQEDCLGIHATEVVRRIREQDPAWERMVPPKVAATIKQRQLFGYVPSA